MTDKNQACIEAITTHPLQHPTPERFGEDMVVGYGSRALANSLPQGVSSETGIVFSLTCTFLTDRAGPRMVVCALSRAEMVSTTHCITAVNCP